MIPFLTAAQADKIREPLFDRAFYERWEERQRDRWAVEAFAWEQEQERHRRGRRDLFAFVFSILAVAATCVALFIGAKQ